MNMFRFVKWIVIPVFLVWFIVDSASVWYFKVMLILFVFNWVISDVKLYRLGAYARRRLGRW